MSYDFRDPDAFTAGAVGPPGQRVFYLQVVDDGQPVTLRLEKQQVHALAEYLEGLLDDLPSSKYPTPAPELLEPVQPVWIVGNIGVGYDNDTDRVIIVAEELVEPDVDSEEQARIMVSRDLCQSFIDRASELIAGGRPPCRLCGAPVDPTGHVCPRDN